MSEILYLSAREIAQEIGQNQNSIYRRAKKVAKENAEATRRTPAGLGIAVDIVYPEHSDKWQEWKKDIEQSAESNDDYADFQEIIQHPATESTPEAQVTAYLISEHKRLTQEVADLKESLKNANERLLLAEHSNSSEKQEKPLEVIKTPSKNVESTPHPKPNNPTLTEQLYVVIPAVVIIASVAFYMLVIEG